MIFSNFSKTPNPTPSVWGASLKPKKGGPPVLPWNRTSTSKKTSKKTCKYAPNIMFSILLIHYPSPPYGRGFWWFFHPGQALWAWPHRSNYNHFISVFIIKHMIFKSNFMCFELIFKSNFMCFELIFKSKLMIIQLILLLNWY